jgi:hypothetical protein|tara:strand:+ start:141 stop:467 length:327 start_codon:yes stop_codon:yes gene_type:complete
MPQKKGAIEKKGIFKGLPKNEPEGKEAYKKWLINKQDRLAEGGLKARIADQKKTGRTWADGSPRLSNPFTSKQLKAADVGGRTAAKRKAVTKPKSKLKTKFKTTTKRR